MEMVSIRLVQVRERIEREKEKEQNREITVCD